jgi:very-short-patch-repair endonuclease
VGTTGPGLFTHQLYRSLVEQPVRLTRDVLARHLLREQQIGTMRFRRRRWKSDNVDQPDGDTPATAGGMRYLETIPADVLAGSRAPTASEDPPESDERPEGWPLLRRLLPYYRECLRLAGASRLSQHVDRHRKQFELLRVDGRWWPDDAGTRVLRVERRHLTPEFLEGLHKRQSDPLLLGYPMSVARAGEDNVFVDPVAILPCAWEIDDTALVLWPTETAPKLNPDWVGKRKERRRVKTLSLWINGLADDEPQSDTNMWRDVPDLLDTLRAVAAAPSAGPLEPGRTQARLDLRADGTLQNTIGLFLVGQSPYNRRTREDLLALSEWRDEDFAGTALSGIFTPGDEANGTPAPVVPPLPVTESQYLAVRDGLSQPLTMISGPPGTGKSQVVVAHMISAAVAGRSVLFVSHRHQAIDAVQSRLEELLAGKTLLARAYAGSQDESFSFDQAIDLILGRYIGPQARDAFEERRTAIARLSKVIDNRLGAVEDYGVKGENLTRLNSELRRRDATDNALARPARRSIMAVIAGWFRSILRRRKPPPQSPIASGDDLAPLTTPQIRQRLQQSERAHRETRAALEADVGIRELPEKLETLSRDGKALLPTLIDALHACTQDDAASLVDLQGNLALARGSGGAHHVWRESANLILRHLPLWACSTLAVPARIPLVPALFDYLIIDEATTSDIASALPLFARARQALVVGDRQQTQMISDLHPARDAELFRRNGLAQTSLGRFVFSKISLFDLVGSSPSTRRHMLRDHFRCHAEIAGYFSETFYDGRLFVRTAEADLRTPKGQRPGLHWTHVAGPIERAGNGCRSHAEAAALVDHLVDLVADGTYEGSVGVVTPFKRQAELLIRMIEQRLPQDVITKVRLRVGTSHAFQGDDRDVVLVSLCYGPDMPRGAKWFLRESREVINVGISRARAVCLVFGDRTAAAASDIKHIARLAAKIGAEGAPQDVLHLFESPWEEKLYHALKRAGLDPAPQYRLAGRRLDLALIEGDIRLDVEVDGETYHRDPDGFRKVSDIWRDHVVTSLGWRVRRFWVYELKEDMERCVGLTFNDLGR